MKKMPSMAEIARKAGVGKTTVSLALRNDPRISEGQRQRVQQIAKEMGYQTNALVARLMFELRASRQQKHQGTLALINCSRAANVRKLESTFDEWCLGVEEQAAIMGYSIDPFWVHEPGLTAGRLGAIFRARNILGAIFFALEGEDVLCPFEPVWSRFPCITIGTRVRNPALNFVANDHFSTGYQATQALLALGYSRIGMITDRWLHVMLESRFVAGWNAALDNGPIPRPTLRPLFLQGYLASDPASDRELLSGWLKKNRPDVCLSLGTGTHESLCKLGYRIPEEIGVAQLDVTRELRGTAAGMEQRHLLAGKAAVDTLVGQIFRRETGVPAFQRGILIEGAWSMGPTVRKHGPPYRGLRSVASQATPAPTTPPPATKASSDSFKVKRV